MCVAREAEDTRAGRAFREEPMDDQRATGPDEGYGDDQGTRVGAPDQSASSSQADGSSRPQRKTGTGSEASEGIHNARHEQGREEGDRTGLTGEETGPGVREGGQRTGSEPLGSEGDQHRSGYGGSGGSPVRSSDQREESRKR
jgi:hypothetical protein